MIEIAPRSNQPYNYNQAFLYILTCSHNNYKDWRFPTKREYQSTPSIRANSWYDEDPCPWDKDDKQYIRYIVPVRDPNDN